MLSSGYLLYAFDREYFSCFDIIIIIMSFYLVYDDWLEYINALFCLFPVR